MLAMRELIQLQRIVQAVCDSVKISPDMKSAMKSTLWENNAGALT